MLKRTAVLLSWADGEEEAFREGVAMSMGDVVVIVNRVRLLTTVQNDILCGIDDRRRMYTKTDQKNVYNKNAGRRSTTSQYSVEIEGYR